MKKLGLIINPIAGMGGRVGLKGTDGCAGRAQELGAKPEAPARAMTALQQLAPLKDELLIYTGAGVMGEDAARACGFNTIAITSVQSGFTTSRDTIETAQKLLAETVDLLIFAGGDGTARDIYTAIGEELVVIGIPAGVKIHSAVYAGSPLKAGELALEYLFGRVARVQEAEVMDIDEEAFRQGIVTSKLYGCLKIPYQKKYLQGAKQGTIQSEDDAKEAIAFDVIENMEQDVLYIIGPGSTTRPIMRRLGLASTLLGVDLICNKKLVALDVTEEQILELSARKRCKLIITPIGGQGFLFGRGNQQISPVVIRQVGEENIIVVATKQKITSLHSGSFLVDSGDTQLDAALRGYIRATVGYKESIVFKVS